MNPFARHGIERLSPSSLNLFDLDPACWVVRHLYRAPGGRVGKYAHRANGIEFGIQHGLSHPPTDIEEAIRVAVSRYEREIGLGESTEEDREFIADGVTGAIRLLEPYGPLTGVQPYVETEIAGIEVPVVGFADYVFPKAVVELKCYRVLPEALGPDDLRQVAIYAMATGLKPVLLYISGEGCRCEEVTVDAAWEEVAEIAFRLRDVLLEAETREAAAARFWPTDVSSYRWSGRTRALGQELWPQAFRENGEETGI